MLFLVSTAGFAATMFGFFYLTQLVKQGRSPAWLKREWPSLMATLVTTVLMALTLTGMYMTAAPGRILLDITLGTGAAIAAAMAAYYLARAAARRSSRGGPGVPA